MNPVLRSLIALAAFTSIWIGIAIIIAGVRAALEGTPDQIVGAMLLLAAFPV